MTNTTANLLIESYVSTSITWPLAGLLLSLAREYLALQAYANKQIQNSQPGLGLEWRWGQAPKVATFGREVESV